MIPFETTDQIEAEMLEAVHEAHQQDCPICDQEESQRVELAVLLRKEQEAAQAVEEGIQEALGLWKRQGIGVHPLVRQALEMGLKRASVARR